MGLPGSKPRSAVTPGTYGQNPTAGRPRHKGALQILDMVTGYAELEAQEKDLFGYFQGAGWDSDIESMYDCNQKIMLKDYKLSTPRIGLMCGAFHKATSECQNVKQGRYFYEKCPATTQVESICNQWVRCSSGKKCCTVEGKPENI